MRRAAGIVLLVLFVVVVLRTAWLSDDAYITFRTVRNFVAGDGLRWNLAERVQSFTHPAWMFVLSAGFFVTREIYATCVVISVLLAAAGAALIVYRVTPTRALGTTVLAFLVCSRAYVDYSTSGLENPLVHLLLATCAWCYLREEQPAEAARPRSIFPLFLAAGLCTVTRLDTVLLIAPMLVTAWWRQRGWRAHLHAAAGLAPLVLWEAFSVIYYGVPFPNTAYAKLPPEISHAALAEQGLKFLASSADYDPVLVPAIALGLLAPLIMRRWRVLPLSIGVSLQLLYVVWVGGDFMAGRFLTGAFLLALIAAAWSAPRRPWSVWAAVAVIPLGLSLLVLGDRSPLLADGDYGFWPLDWNIDASGVADERGVYYQSTGLLRTGAAFETPRDPWFDDGATLAPGSVSVALNLGFRGWAAPRDAFIVDRFALSDAFVARLPPAQLVGWRPGHLERTIPDGYLESLRTGENHLVDPAHAALFDDVQLVVRGPIWSAARWRAIWRLNTR